MGKYTGTIYEDLENIEEFEEERQCAGCGAFTEVSKLKTDTQDELEYCDECRGK